MGKNDKNRRVVATQNLTDYYY